MSERDLQAEQTRAGYRRRRKRQGRGGRWLKLVSGSVMLALGAALIGRPAWLVW